MRYVEYKMDHAPRVARSLARQLGVKYEDNGYQYRDEDTFVKVKAFQLNKHLSIMISHFGSNELIRVFRSGTYDKDLVTLDFHISDKVDLSLASSQGPKSLVYGAYLASTDIESFVDFNHGKENRQVGLVFHRNWIKEFFRDKGAQLETFLDANESFFLFREIDLELVKNIYHCYDYTLGGSGLEEKYVLGHTIKILSRFFDQFVEGRAGLGLGNVNTDDVSQLMAAKKYIDLHKEDAVAVTDLIKLTMMSESKFRKAFKSVFGLNPHEYIKQVKLWHAKGLVESGYTISQAGHAIGYSNLSYFARSFKEIFGVSPLEYKRTIFGD